MRWRLLNTCGVLCERHGHGCLQSRMTKIVVSGLKFFIAWKESLSASGFSTVLRNTVEKECVKWNFVKEAGGQSQEKEDCWASSWRSKDPLGREGSVCIWTEWAASTKAWVRKQHKRLWEWPVVLFQWKVGCCGVGRGGALEGFHGVQVMCVCLPLPRCLTRLRAKHWIKVLTFQCNLHRAS